jgi:hypothetical protein
MVAYSFQPRFVQAILSGRKCQTIRAVGRRRHARPGEALQLYTGMRTRQCRLIGTAVCLAAEAVELRLSTARGSVRTGNAGTCRIGDSQILDMFAEADGFSDWSALCDFWRATYGRRAFRGVLIRWDGEAFVPGGNYD